MGKTIDRESFVLRWLETRGLLQLYSSMSPNEILNKLGCEAIPCVCSRWDCSGWKMALQNGSVLGPVDAAVKKLGK